MGKEIDTGSLSAYLKDLSSVANAPYLWEPARRKVLGLLVDLEKKRSPDVEWEVIGDEDALYLRLSKGRAHDRYLITCHLDHPYLVFDGLGKAWPFGNFDYDRLDPDGTIPVEVWDKDGSRLGESVLMRKGERRCFTVASGTGGGRNDQATYKMPAFEVREGVVEMSNADDMAMVALSLSLIDSISKSDANFDAVFAFENVEEVKQLSGVGIALKRKTPWWMIGPDTNLIVLEMVDEKLPPKPLQAREQLNLPRPKVGGGPGLRVNDRELIYGQKSGYPNYLEARFLAVARAVDLEHQYTVQAGFCDGGIFSGFNLGPNIVGLTVVDNYRHNEGEAGLFVPEKFHLRDLELAGRWIYEVICGKDVTSDKDFDYKSLLSQRLRATSLLASDSYLQGLVRERVRTYRAMKPRLEMGKYFPDSLSEWVKFVSAVAFAYMRTFL